jgi:hypothetical protein
VGEGGTEGKGKAGHEFPEGDAGGTSCVGITVLGVGDRGDRGDRRDAHALIAAVL